MAADNNLDPSAMQDLESIRKASIYSDMDIVVQLDRWEFVDAKEGFRHHFKQGVETIIKELGEVNSGDPKILKAFIEESAEAYPSDKLIVVIWSHGSGVDDMDVYNPSREKIFVPDKEIEEIAIAFDDASKEFIDNLELQKALDVSVEIDVLGFDACLMGMFEIAYQLRNQAKVIVGSQYLEPSTGWPYPQIVEHIGHGDTPREVGAKIVQFYSDYYERTQNFVTQSAYSVASIDEVAKLINKFAKVLKENLSNTKSLKLILNQTQNFRSDYIDLVHFIKMVDERLNIEILKPITTELLEALEGFIVANQSMGVGMEDAHGISIYFPTKKVPFKETFEMYEKLDFSQEYPSWVGLIRWYYLS